jgi:hypothetical protein
VRRTYSSSKPILWTVLLVGSLPLHGQNSPTFEVRGNVKFVDQLAEATPVEALTFRIHPLAGGFEIDAQPDSDGKFVLKNVLPGRYSMVFPIGGRLQSFTVAGSESAPEDFDIEANAPGPISIVVSEKVANIVVSASAPSGEKNGVVLLVPADPLLTSPSCYSIKLTGAVTTFPFVPQGRYRVLAFNEKYSATVAGLAPRYPDFLKDEAVFVEATSADSASAAPRYVTDENMEEAIRLAGGPYDPFRAPPANTKPR